MKEQTIEWLKPRAKAGDLTAATVLAVEAGLRWDSGWKCWVQKATLRPVEEK